MHELKEYFVDLFILLTALSANKLAQHTGVSLEVSDFKIDKILYILVMALTGLTTLYRFIKEIRADRKAKREK